MITKGAFIFTWLFSLNLLYYVILFIPEVQQALLVCGYSWLHSPRTGGRSHELPVLLVRGAVGAVGLPQGEVQPSVRRGRFKFAW